MLLVGNGRQAVFEVFWTTQKNPDGFQVDYLTYSYDIESYPVLLKMFEAGSLLSSIKFTVIPQTLQTWQYLTETIPDIDAIYFIASILPKEPSGEYRIGVLHIK